MDDLNLPSEPAFVNFDDFASFKNNIVIVKMLVHSSSASYIERSTNTGYIPAIFYFHNIFRSLVLKVSTFAVRTYSLLQDFLHRM